MPLMFGVKGAGGGRVIRMLIVVVVLFAVCWGPILINNLLVSLRVLDSLHIGHLKPLRQAMFLLSYLNSSLNPLVYGFMSRHFRRGFREAICVCCSTPGRGRGDASFGRGRRGGNTRGCYFATGDDYQASTVRTGTIRLSPVTEQGTVIDEERLSESPLGSVRYKPGGGSRKIWACRNDKVSQVLDNKDG
ncbi:cholecystokinin receptor type A-like [Aplysia californica]|uniref:Cholecystokinin receptor type A-like n=1 Tax=Aplysia californica TaxID=6500 RepID=A0ABM1VWK9_APLCA|nr:cholecystokinin receptor type A-like [Aplysia californica]